MDHREGHIKDKGRRNSGLNKFHIQCVLGNCHWIKAQNLKALTDTIKALNEEKHRADQSE